MMEHKSKLESARELYNLIGGEDAKASLVSALQEKPPSLEECVAEVKAMRRTPTK